MSSKKVFCGCDIFVLTKAFTGSEIGVTFLILFFTISELFINDLLLSLTLTKILTLVAWIVHLFLELYGLQKRKNVIIVIGCIIRCLFTLITMIVIIDHCWLVFNMTRWEREKFYQLKR